LDLEAFDLTIEGLLGRIPAGDRYPVRVMAVINLGEESFYKGSVASPDGLLERAWALLDEGADMIDLGAVSTAPGSPSITMERERERLIPALSLLRDNMDVEISVDTQRSDLADCALSRGASCVNDVSGLLDPDMASTIADHDASLVIMASRRRPGDILRMKDIIRLLAERLDIACEAGISRERIIVDPGVGRWIPEKGFEHDLAILDGLERLRVLERPVLAALSRKSFIGTVLDLPSPTDRLAGSLAAAAIAVYNGAHILRTHDVARSLDAITLARAVRGRPAEALRPGIEVEVLERSGHRDDMQCRLKGVGAGEGALVHLGVKGAFRLISLKGISSMEALIIKQEMLARGGDAAISREALRCAKLPQTVLIMGTLAQIMGLSKKLRLQPFDLPVVAEALEEALDGDEDVQRYR